MSVDDAFIQSVTLSAVGCPDPEISVNAMLTRKEETLAIFCNQTGERWHLVCKENQWIGTYNNCSKS